MCHIYMEWNAPEGLQELCDAQRCSQLDKGGPRDRSCTGPAAIGRPTPIGELDFVGGNAVENGLQLGFWKNLWSAIG